MVDGRCVFLEKLSGWTYSLLHLPQRGSAIEAEGIERPDLRQRRDFVAAHAATANQLIECFKSMTDGRWAMADMRWPMGDIRWAMADIRWPMVAGCDDRQRPEMGADVTEAFVCMERFKH